MIVIIMETIGAGGFYTLVFGCLILVVCGVVFGSPIIVWTTLYDTMRMGNGDDSYFWLFVAAQAIFAVSRAFVIARREKSSAIIELLVEGVFLFVTFYLALAAEVYFGMREVFDISYLQEAGVYDLSFIDILQLCLSSSFYNPQAVAFVAFIAAVAPVFASYIFASLLRRH